MLCEIVLNKNKIYSIFTKNSTWIYLYILSFFSLKNRSKKVPDISFRVYKILHHMNLHNLHNTWDRHYDPNLEIRRTESQRSIKSYGQEAGELANQVRQSDLAYLLLQGKQLQLLISLKKDRRCHCVHTSWNFSSSKVSILKQ